MLGSRSHTSKILSRNGRYSSPVATADKPLLIEAKTSILGLPRATVSFPILSPWPKSNRVKERSRGSKVPRLAMASVERAFCPKAVSPGAGAVLDLRLGRYAPVDHPEVPGLTRTKNARIRRSSLIHGKSRVGHEKRPLRESSRRVVR
jgi:hypothetical protein